MPVTRTWSTTWGSNKTRQNTTPQDLHRAVASAHGERERVYFGGDGALYILNHTRHEKCPSVACAACNAHHPGHVAVPRTTVKKNLDAAKRGPRTKAGKK